MPQGPFRAFGHAAQPQARNQADQETPKTASGDHGHRPPGQVPAWPNPTPTTHNSPRADPPIGADFGSMPIMMLAIQIWAFCAFTSVADGDR